MKLELSDSLSNNSDFSSDSQQSQLSTNDFITSGLLLTPTTFITLEGLNSGVPTRTTPTLTPTTLRNIEQTFIELQSKPESHENEAGFVPPLVPPIGNNQYIPISEVDIYSKSSSSPWHSSISPHSQDSNSRPTPPVTPKSMNSVMSAEMTTTTTSTGSRRNMGGRKPAKDLNLSPEEEERRRIRRERNKMAAARCRKRRVDHTNTLIAETESLEQIKQSLQNEIQDLKAEKDELEYYLQSHRVSQFCRRNRPLSPPDVKPYDLPPPPISSNERVKTELVDAHNNTYTTSSNNNNNNNNTTDYFTAPNPAKRIMLSSTVPISKPNRPSSLNVTTLPAINGKTGNISELAGITITTPSNGIQLNFDSLMVGGTGLTPVAAPLVQCSAQQRNNGVATCVTTDGVISVGSPDSSKLVSL